MTPSLLTQCIDFVVKEWMDVSGWHKADVSRPRQG